MLSADVIDDESARASDDMSIDPDIPAVQDPGRAPGLHDDIDARIVKNSLWVGLSYGGGQILAMVSMLVLLRLLTPSDFGVVAIGMTLLGVLAYVQESGLGSALVHFREDPRHTAASALIFSAVSSGSLALGVALLAPVYTHLVHSPQSTGIVRALSVVLLLRGLAIIPGAILERALLFKTRAKSELSGYIMLATVSISCAAFGLGPWSLVLGQIAATGTQLTAVWLLVPWRPRLRDASRATLVGMLRYGRFVSASNLLNLIGLSLDNLTVSRQLGSGPLGVYALSYRLAEIPNTVISIVVGRVMFSVYSSLHGNLAALRHAYLENLRRTMLFALPVTLGIGIAADPIVPALLGDQWLTAETPLRILRALRARSPYRRPVRRAVQGSRATASRGRSTRHVLRRRTVQSRDPGAAPRHRRRRGRDVHCRRRGGVRLHGLPAAGAAAVLLRPPTGDLSAGARGGSVRAGAPRRAAVRAEARPVAGARTPRRHRHHRLYGIRRAARPRARAPDLGGAPPSRSRELRSGVLQASPWSRPAGYPASIPTRTLRP